MAALLVDKVRKKTLDNLPLLNSRFLINELRSRMYTAALLCTCVVVIATACDAPVQFENVVMCRQSTTAQIILQCRAEK